MSINVEPLHSLVNDPVKIYGSGFKPRTQLTVMASVVSDLEQFSFCSYAHISCDENGCFDLSSTPSVGGTYQGVQPMGLFWSMQKVPESKRDRFQIINASNSFVYTFKVFDNVVEKFENELCGTQIERLPIGNNISRTVVKVGRIHGVLFCPPGEGPHPVVITLYGGTKKRKPIEDVAALLVNNGFVTLALAYFNVGDLPRTYEKINVEYFEEAVDFLTTLDMVNSNAIGVYGISTGATIALSMAHFLPRKIRSVVAMGAPLYNTAGSISYRGTVIPKINVDFSRYPYDLTEHYTIAFNPCYAGIGLHDPALVPFIDTAADILFVYGRDDANLPVERLQSDIGHYVEKSGKKNYEVMLFEGMGHLVDLPYTPVTVSALPATLKSKVHLEYGGRDTQKHALSQIKTWKAVMEFFLRTLKIPKSSL